MQNETPEQRQKRLAYNAQWREANRELMRLAAADRYRLESPAERRKRRRCTARWRRKNKQRTRQTSKIYYDTYVKGDRARA